MAFLNHHTPNHLIFFPSMHSTITHPFLADEVRGKICADGFGNGK